MRIIETKTQQQYRENYLTGTHWQTTRAKKLSQVKSCQMCGRRNFLHIHHKTYENRGHEQMGDLIVLCRICHLELHRNRITLEQIEIRQKKKEPKDPSLFTILLRAYTKSFKAGQYGIAYNMFMNTDQASLPKQQQRQFGVMIKKLTNKYNKESRGKIPLGGN